MDSFSRSEGLVVASVAEYFLISLKSPVSATHMVNFLDEIDEVNRVLVLVRIKLILWFSCFPFIFEIL